jgi:hypothetical protein
VRLPPDRRYFRNRLIGRTRDSESRNPGSNPGSGTKTGHVFPRSLTTETQQDGARRSTAVGCAVSGGVHRNVSFFQGGLMARSSAVNGAYAGSTPAPGTRPASHSWERTSFVTRIRVVRLHSPAPRERTSSWSGDSAALKTRRARIDTEGVHYGAVASEADAAVTRVMGFDSPPCPQKRSSSTTDVQRFPKPTDGGSSPSSSANCRWGPLAWTAACQAASKWDRNPPPARRV